MNQVICKNDYDLLTSRDFYPDLSHSKATPDPWIMSSHSTKFHKDLVSHF